MTLIDLLLLLLIAGICGSLGQAIAGYSRGGCLVSIALGFVGALLGMWLARAMGLPELFPVQIGTTTFPIVWSIIGSNIICRRRRANIASRLATVFIAHDDRNAGQNLSF